MLLTLMIYLRSSIFYITLLFSSNLWAGDKDVIVMTDSQNFIEQVQSKSNAGTISSVYSLLYGEIGLPEQLVLLPLKRQNRALDQTDYAACTLYRFKTKARAAKYLFSVPIYFLLHYKLYQQPDLLLLPESVLDANGHISSLTAIHSLDEKAKFLIIPAYSYGDIIDLQIEALPDAAKIEWRGSNPHNKLSNLFFSNRGQYALMFPSEVKAHQLTHPDDQFNSYRISGLPYATLGYMMCNKHVDSYAYINTVNSGIKALYSTTEYLKAHTLPYSENEYEEISATLNKLIAGKY